jgi:hypothetical protein
MRALDALASLEHALTHFNFVPEQLVHGIFKAI